VAIQTAHVSVAGTAVNLLTGFVNAASISDQLPVAIRNMQAAGGTTAWIGGPDVSSSNGFPLYGQESFPMQLLTSDTPYAVSDSGTITLAVMVGRQSG
jgi:hypothetical protein